jgi:hypothetical protein
MALAIVSGNEEWLTVGSPARGAQSVAGEAASEGIAHALAVLRMAGYHWPAPGSTLPQDQSDALLRSVLPLRRLVDRAAAQCATAFGASGDVASGLAQAAAMARMLAATIEEEAIGSPISAFAWLADYVWALRGQLEAVQAGIQLAAHSGAH